MKHWKLFHFTDPCLHHVEMCLEENPDLANVKVCRCFILMGVHCSLLKGLITPGRFADHPKPVC